MVNQLSIQMNSILNRNMNIEHESSECLIINLFYRPFDTKQPANLNNERKKKTHFHY